VVGSQNDELDPVYQEAIGASGRIAKTTLNESK
jgi:hypothetical protein